MVHFVVQIVDLLIDKLCDILSNFNRHVLYKMVCFNYVLVMHSKTPI